MPGGSLLLGWCCLMASLTLWRCLAVAECADAFGDSVAAGPCDAADPAQRAHPVRPVEVVHRDQPPHHGRNRSVSQSVSVSQSTSGLSVLALTLCAYPLPCRVVPMDAIRPGHGQRLRRLRSACGHSQHGPAIRIARAVLRRSEIAQIASAAPD